VELISADPWRFRGAPSQTRLVEVISPQSHSWPFPAFHFTTPGSSSLRKLSDQSSRDVRACRA
jgi:hypothetical protein